MTSFSAVLSYVMSSCVFDLGPIFRQIIFRTSDIDVIVFSDDTVLDLRDVQAPGHRIGNFAPEALPLVSHSNLRERHPTGAASRDLLFASLQSILFR